MRHPTPFGQCRPGGRECANSVGVTARRASAGVSRSPPSGRIHRPVVTARRASVSMSRSHSARPASMVGLVEPAGVGEVARIDDRLRVRSADASRIVPRLRGRSRIAPSVSPSAGSGTSPSPTYGAVAKMISMSGRPGAIPRGRRSPCARTRTPRRRRGEHPATRGQVARQLPDALRIEEGAAIALPERVRTPGGPADWPRPRGRRPAASTPWSARCRPDRCPRA